MKTIAGIVISLLLGAFFAQATTYNSNGSASDVQAKINLATAGDTVTIPAGSFTWTTGVNLNKAVHLQGTGSGRIIGWSRSSATFGTGTKTFTVQSGFTADTGTTLRVWATATDKETNYMLGTVTSVSGTTLTMDITSNTGSGTKSLWLIATEYSTRIVDNAGSTTLLRITESTAGNAQVSGIQFANGTGAGFLASIGYASGGQPVLIHDCWFWQTVSGGSVMLDFNTAGGGTNRGVIWNCSFAWSFFAQAAAPGIHLTMNGRTEVWSSPSTMGMDDTTGTNNVYIEDCDAHGCLDLIDADSNSKVVWRHNVNDHAALGGHGYDTSAFGARHWEVYDNQFLFANLGTASLNLTKHILFRGGTGVITDNYFEDINSQAWGNKPEINFGVWNLGRWGQSPGAYDADGNCVPHYPSPRQFGFGYVTGMGVDGQGHSTSNGVYVGDLEPAFIWNNTGFTPRIDVTTDGTPCIVNQYGHVPDDPDNYIQEGREYYVGVAKPGYTKYTYPHPLRGSTGPEAPGHLRILP